MLPNEPAIHSRITHGIRKKLLLAMIGLVTSLMAVLTWFQISTQTEVLHNELGRRESLMKNILQERGKTLSDEIARQAENDIASISISNLAELSAHAVKENQVLRYIILMDRNRIANIHTEHPELELEVLSEPEDLFAVEQGEPTIKEYRSGGDPLMEFITPIYVGIDTWGVLRLGFSLSSLNLEIQNAREAISVQIRNMVLRAIVTTALIILFGCVATLWISTRLAKPITSLTESALRLAKGDFSVADQIQVHSKDEVGVLSDAFKTMGENLRDSYAALEETNRTLELRVDERTRELRQKNQELEEEIALRRRAEQTLSLVFEKQTERFHAGGTLRHDAPSYVERQADAQLLEGLTHGELCYVLTARQMGKSSLMVRTANQLKQKAIHVITLDLTAIGINVTSEQWYDGLLTRLGWQLKLEDELEDFWTQYSRLSPVQRFFDAIREVILTHKPGPVVIFVDELDIVRSLPFSSDEFFAAIRECYNRRTEDERFHRLAFCLLGVATPHDLIKDPHTTPFNIGYRISLNDFTADEIAPLAKGLNTNLKIAGELMERVYYWSAGHPYLTQRLCKALAAEQNIQLASEVDDLCDRMFLSPRAREEDDNLVFVREMILKGVGNVEGLLQFYDRIRSGDPIVADSDDPSAKHLELAGLIQEDNGILRVRNRIYERVFDSAWIQRQLRIVSAAPR
ncbi:MAG: AAA-like domain-containing protein [Verrucomicrobia bacterium]|nr:AAA-like domain-containing protein [Verrucomicrobiota bacterium]